jgi:hypothetical protein
MYKMGRYRTLSRSQDSVSYIDYYEKKNSISTLKYARSIVNTNKNTDNFKLNCCNTNPVNSACCYIAVFQSYASLMRLIKQQAYFDKKCNCCTDIPLTLMNGLKSEVCFDDFYKAVDNYVENKCDELYVRNVNTCTEKLGYMFPYGYFNNNAKSPNMSLKRKLYLKCDKMEKCPTYVYCKCNKETKEKQEECSCSEYDVVFPYNNEFVTYSISACESPELYEYFNNPYNRPENSYASHMQKRNTGEILQEESYKVFSKFNTGS